MNTRQKLDILLRDSADSTTTSVDDRVLIYAQCVSAIENAVVVVSDLSSGHSRIFCGAFAKKLGIDRYDDTENSIWEKVILDRMTESEREEKFIAELRFFHYLRRIPRHRRSHFMLETKLKTGDTDVLHKMYYVYYDNSVKIHYAVCIYEPMIFALPARSIVIDSSTGTCEILENDGDNQILSRREMQVLALVECGKSSKEIAAELSISLHTVSRHRQEILSKLRARNSHEACRAAKSLGLL